MLRSHRHKGSLPCLLGAAMAVLLAPGASAVDSSENAALRYWRAWALVTPELETAASEAMRTWDTDAKWAAKLTPQLRGELESDGILMKTILRATAFRECDFAPDVQDGFDAVIPHLGSMRMTARLLVIDARLAMEAGDDSQAADRLAACYRLAQHTGQDMVFISSLVSIAIFQLVDEQAAYMAEHDLLDTRGKAVLRDALSTFDENDPIGMLDGLEGERRTTLAWVRDNLPSEDTEATCKFLADYGASEAQPTEWAAFIEAMKTDEGIARAVEGLERYYDDILALWPTDDADVRIKELSSRVTNGEYGDLARWLAPFLPRAHVQWTESRQALIEAQRRVR
ncbi:MAG: hypothetical protein KAS72_15645 [Phycisphaerales bacterium]|nr:hypothetical protein [Phycisphaerales bacterium]